MSFDLLLGISHALDNIDLEGADSITDTVRPGVYTAWSCRPCREADARTPDNPNDGYQAQVITTISFWGTASLNFFPGATRLLTTRRGTSVTASKPMHKPYKPATSSKRSCSLFTRTIPNHALQSRSWVQCD